MIFLVWTLFVTIAGGVSAVGALAPENDVTPIRRLEPGIVRQVFVHNGDHVRPGQLLMQFDDVEPKSQVQVLDNQYAFFAAQRARWMAEAAGSSHIDFPQDLRQAAASDPSVAIVLADQQSLLTSRLQAFQAQVSVLGQRIEQIKSRIEGLKAQEAANEQESKLIADEQSGIQALYDKGYAPKTRLLALQRSAAGLAGDHGNLIAQLSEAQQQIGESQNQLQQVRGTRLTEISTGLADSQSKLSDVLPRRQAVQGVFERATVRSPIDGYVMNMAPVSIGQAAPAGEPLLQIVPANQPLVLQVHIRPQDAHDVQTGAPAQVRLTGIPRSKMSYLDGVLSTVSADTLVDPKTGPYYAATVTINPTELRKLGEGVRLFPGMPGSVIIVTQNRTIFEYLFGPLRDTFDSALRED